MSLFSDNLTTITMTDDAECERHHLPDAKELKGKLLLADRGHDGTEYLASVGRQHANVGRRRWFHVICCRQCCLPTLSRTGQATSTWACTVTGVSTGYSVATKS